MGCGCVEFTLELDLLCCATLFEFERFCFDCVQLFTLPEPVDATLQREYIRLKDEILEEYAAAKISGAWIDTIYIE